MNILFINSIAKNKFGGGEKWMVKAAKGLTDAGHRVFLAGKKGGEILRAAQEAGVQTRVFNIYSDFSPLNTWRIARFLKRENIEVLVCNLNKDVRVAGLAAKIAGTPLVIARHGVLLCGKKWKHKITLQNLVDGILTNTETIKQIYLSYGWFREDFIKVIYNGIEPKDNVQPFDFGTLFPGKKVIFSAGRLSEQKGFSYLIQAAAQLLEKRDDLAFAVAGKGRLENELKRRVKHHGIEHSFRFLGFVKNIDPYIKGCDLFVLSSLFEGMPNVVMEAMAVGKAVVATDVNGVRELMEDGKTGVIIPPRDPNILAETIDKLIDNRALLEQYGKNGRQRVQERFTIPVMIKNLENYFIDKLNEKRNSATN